jgi:hypothetical protein
MRRVMGARPPSTPKLQMPPPPPPPAQMDRPDVAEAEMELLNAPKSEVTKAKYTKKRKGKAKGKSHSNYKGGGLNV